MNNTELNNHTPPLLEPEASQPPHLDAPYLPNLDARISGLESVFKAGPPDKTDFPITDPRSLDTTSIAKNSSLLSSVAPGVYIASSPTPRTLISHCQHNTNTPYSGASIIVTAGTPNKRIAKYVGLQPLDISLAVPDYLTHPDKQTNPDPALSQELDHILHNKLQALVMTGSQSFEGLYAGDAPDCKYEELYASCESLPVEYADNAIWVMTLASKNYIHEKLMSTKAYEEYARALSGPNPTLFNRPLLTINYPADIEPRLVLYGDLQSAYAVFESQRRPVVSKLRADGGGSELALLVNAGGVVLNTKAFRLMKLTQAD